MSTATRASAPGPPGAGVDVAAPATTERIVAVGGHPVIQGLVRLACAGVEGAVVVAEATSIAEARDAFARATPDVLVLDLDLPDGDGLEFLAELRDRAAAGTTAALPRTLAISHREDGGTVLAAMRLGALGYITKGDGLRGLTTALRGVTLGERIVPPQVESIAEDELGRFARRTRELAAAEHALSAREREVLELLAEGFTLQQIGRRLSISPRTVETHAGSIYRKLDVRTRLQAVSRAAAIGLIDLR